MFGSRVEPDLLETKKRVFSRSILFSKDLICAGSVESSTCRSGNPSIFPNDVRKTSGHRLDPPIPMSSASVKPVLPISRANSSKSLALLCCASAMSSQPSHLLSSLPVQSEASRAHSLLILLPAVHSSRVSSTAREKLGGRKNVC